MPVEATGVEGEPNTGLEEQRPDVERRPRRAGPLQPAGDRGFVRRLERDLVKGLALSVE